MSVVETNELWEDVDKNNNTILPSSDLNNEQVLDFYNFLDNLSLDCFPELKGCNKDTTIDNLLKILNRRISIVKNYKKDSIELANKLINNYICIYQSSTNEPDDIYETNNEIPCPTLDSEVWKFHTKDKQNNQIVGYGYVYKVLLDIRTENYFHVYFNPFIDADIFKMSALVYKNQVRNISFENLLKTYKIISKEEYENQLKELFSEISSDK